MPSPRKIAVLIGRFQPFHLGHQRLIELGLSSAERVLVVLGSAYRATSPRNPFSWQQRVQMIQETFDTAQASRIQFLPIRDYFNTQRWADQLARQVSAVAEGAQIVLINGLRDQRLLKHPMLSQWHRMDCARVQHFDSTRIRDSLFLRAFPQRADLQADFGITQLTKLVPEGILKWLNRWQGTSHYEHLAREWLNLTEYRRSWSSAPFPPVFVTADCVVRCLNRVLLVQRKFAPGLGLWALPGGFIDCQETILQSALRELVEETQIGLTEDELISSLSETCVFDHPQRSERGRIVTHAHFFDLQQQFLPSIAAADDAMQAKWTDIELLASMEDSFHDDHFAILDHFLQVLHEPAC